MSMPIEEHDYMGLSDVSSRDNYDNNGLNLKATELRLGLPGFESPERDTEFCINDVNVCTPRGVLSSGAKRDFSDTIVSAPGKWSLFNNGGSEVDMVKNGVLFSPRSVNGGKINGVGVCESNSQSTVMASCAEKVVSSQVLKKKPQSSAANDHGAPSSARAQVIGWPPIRSFRKNSMTTNPPKNDKNADAMWASSCIYVKVSMDGAPYLRKVDLRIYSNYLELSSGLEKMFSCFTIGQCGSHEVSDQHGLSEGRSMELLHGSEYVLTYEDKDGDWMLVGDVPWDMFIESCKRMRIMNSSDAVGLAPKAMEKCRTVTNVVHTRL